MYYSNTKTETMQPQSPINPYAQYTYSKIQEYYLEHEQRGIKKIHAFFSPLKASWLISFFNVH